MSYSQPLINQPRILFLSIGVGMLLGIVYVLIQGAFRILGDGKVSYYLADSVFVVVFTLVSFFFMVLYNEGRVRLHLILGEGAGFSAFYLCAGRYIYVLIRKLSEFLNTVLKKLVKPYAFIFSSFFCGIKNLFIRLKRKIYSLNKNSCPKKKKEEKKTKKFNLFAKIHLKKDNKSV